MPLCLPWPALPTQPNILSLQSSPPRSNTAFGRKCLLGFKDEWLACQYLSDDYPQYAAITNGLISAGVPTETFQAIIRAAEDTAVPDDVFRRMYDREMKTSKGRVKWHGPVVTNIIDTANLKRIQVFEYGYTWT